MPDIEASPKGKPWSGLLPLGMGLLVLVAGLVLGWESGTTLVKHADAIDDWTQNLSHASVEIVDVMEGALGQMDRTIELDLMQEGRDLAQGNIRPEAAMAAFAKAAAKTLPLRVVAVFGAQGNTLVSSDRSLDRPNMTVKSRDFFTALRDGRTERMMTASYLTGPVLERAAPRMLILLARRLNDDAGGFAGVLVVGLDADLLTHGIQDPAILAGLEIRLLDGGGKLVGVHPETAGKIGQSVSDPVEFSQTKPFLPRIGVQTSPFSDVLEISALRRVGSSQFVVSVKSNTAPDLGPRWWWGSALFGGASAIFMILGFWLLSHGLGGGAPVKVGVSLRRRRRAPFGRVLALFGGTLAAMALAVYGFASLALYLGQRHLLFENATFGDLAHPRRIGMTSIRPLKVDTADGLTLSMWLKPPYPGCPMVVYFHGNDGDVKVRAFKMEPFIHAGWGALFAEYRGYAGNPGRPSEAGIYEDSRAAIRQLAAEGIPSGQAVFLGESLGSGVAVKAAEEFGPAALILVAPYTSIADVAQNAYWYMPAGLLMRDRFPSVSRIANVHSPVMIIHGEADKTIPVALARELLAAAAEPKRGVFIPGADHNNLFSYGAVDAIASFADPGGRCPLDEERSE